MIFWGKHVKGKGYIEFGKILVSDPKSGILGLFSFFRGQIKNKAGFYVFLDVHARKLKKWATENIGQ